MKRGKDDGSWSKLVVVAKGSVDEDWTEGLS